MKRAALAAFLLAPAFGGVRASAQYMGGAAPSAPGIIDMSLMEALVAVKHPELAAFAQFGSDLDKASQAQLARGQRLVELLKQDQYKPLAVEDQVVIIYAGTNGYFDDLPVTGVKKFELHILSELRTRHADVLKLIVEKREMSDEVKSKVAAALDAIKKGYKA